MNTQFKSFETGIYRPPSEGGSSSLLVRLTRNCPWNHCTFCAMYKEEKFQLRTPEEIIQDIDAMHAIYLQIQDIADDTNPEGRITHEAVRIFIRRTPELSFHQGISMLVEWMLAGGKTVFLQDADSLIMKTDHMIQVLTYLKACFPKIERITTYARSKTIAKKPAADLEKIRKAGLNRVHIGLETGDRELLKAVKKGATPEDHIKGGIKALEAGFQVSEYWMPGLGCRSQSENHALNTADVLNKINPHFIRSRPFHPYPGTDFYEKAVRNQLDLLSPKELLMEIKQTIQALKVTSRVCFDHAANGWAGPDGMLLLSQSYEGYKFPEEKNRLLDLIETGIRHYS
ncbi:MAG: radical SAM protein [Proteobacteria bacterium]|nr:radical SAM protein [Pseudomonadota bacterium]MBU1388103.1 radical SAM protein [Pseudomonadota bacterium]MBU1542167.1 radical SAM protein [Pseudomonadota bacterium]MBU2430666.1 radical SAM protein [Pseudomonadota bacterium]MBU2481677.1 radical SAM protein [Pseudomonadota bacterium]